MVEQLMASRTWEHGKGRYHILGKLVENGPGSHRLSLCGSAALASFHNDPVPAETVATGDRCTRCVKLGWPGGRQVEPVASTPLDSAPPEHLLYYAWTVIANAGHNQGGWQTQDPEWVAAAERWRDQWHATLDRRGWADELAASDAAQADSVDYQALLAKYMRHVGFEEGTTFVGDRMLSDVEFTDAEMALLRAIERTIFPEVSDG